ncbi:MAG: type II secretion system F family protein [Nannocystaceae bacterium]
MPAYAYTGLNASGKHVKGVETAESVANLKAALRIGGVYLTTVTEAAGGVAVGSVADQGGSMSREIDLSGVFDRVRPKMVASMTRLLSTMLGAGVTLPESLSALVEQTTSERFKGILSDLASKVNEGSALADAIAGHPTVFAPLYVNMVRAGEASGSLEVVLVRIAEYMDQQEELRGKVVSAMFYPVAMGMVGVFVVGLLMVRVVPQISVMFEDQGAELPATTRLLMWVSHGLADYWWAVIAAATFVTWTLRRWRRSATGRRTSDAWLLLMPLLGPMARKLAIARFSRTLATMLASGVQLLDAMNIVKGLLGNVVLEKVVGEARDSIREGQGVATALKKSGHFPPLVTQMIAVGERSGQLEEMLTDLANAYEREASVAVTRATQALEPLMIVLMGGAVGFIVFSIMTPIMEMNKMVGH